MRVRNIYRHVTGNLSLWPSIENRDFFLKNFLVCLFIWHLEFIFLYSRQLKEMVIMMRRVVIFQYWIIKKHSFLSSTKPPPRNGTYFWFCSSPGGNQYYYINRNYKNILSSTSFFFYILFYFIISFREKKKEMKNISKEERLFSITSLFSAGDRLTDCR